MHEGLLLDVYWHLTVASTEATVHLLFSLSLLGVLIYILQILLPGPFLSKTKNPKTTYLAIVILSEGYAIPLRSAGSDPTCGTDGGS